MSASVLILDFGSQYTQLIARRVRELGVSAEIWAPTQGLEFITQFSPQVVFLSGGPSSVYDPGAPQVPQGFWEWQKFTQTWVVGICYGMQLMAHDLGGKVVAAKTREYGRSRVRDLLGSERTVWMSHGDEVTKAPTGFDVTWKNPDGGISGIAHLSDRRLGLQFHLEVAHTEGGLELLREILFDRAHIEPDWKLGDWVEAEVQRVKTKAGSAHVLCALSGGVDSAVAAKLVHQAVGERLHCVFIDHGLLRFDERDQVMKMFERELKLPVTCVDASSKFLGALQGVIDPEKKRKIIGELFIRSFEEFARSQKKPAKFLVQGTLYPDVIESSPGHRLSATIKSHHNVGGLPEKIGFELIEPLRELFKDEVREIGELLGVPRGFLRRHPFPGPGLAVRILGEITPERLNVLARVDKIFIDALNDEGLYDKIWQAFAVFLPVKSVGVQGDGRTHKNAVAIRAVSSVDGMTADWFEFDPAFLKRVSTEICNAVPEVNRVVYDITSKPPATIEWE